MGYFDYALSISDRIVKETWATLHMLCLLYTSDAADDIALV